MAIHHADPAEVISLQPLGEKIADTKTHTLFKTAAMEAIRLVLPAGKILPEHKAPGELIVQCLEGHVQFTAGGTPHTMKTGDMLYLAESEPHAVEATEDSTVLVTIVFTNRR